MIPLQLQEIQNVVLFVAILHLAPILTPKVANGGAQTCGGCLVQTLRAQHGKEKEKSKKGKKKGS
jgi:hypothetical protein